MDSIYVNQASWSKDEKYAYLGVGLLSRILFESYISKSPCEYIPLKMVILKDT